MPHTGEVGFQEIRLLKQKYATSSYFSKRMLKLHVLPPGSLMPEVDAMVLALSTYVLEQKLESRQHVVIFKVPATWWDHLKQRLGWGTPRMRELREVVKFEVRAAYPEATIAAELGKPVVFSRIKSLGTGCHNRGS